MKGGKWSFWLNILGSVILEKVGEVHKRSRTTVANSVGYDMYIGM